MHTNKAPLLHIFGLQTITVSIQQNGNSFRRDVQSTSNGRVLIVRTHQVEHRALCILIVHKVSNKLCTGCTSALPVTVPFVVNYNHVGSGAKDS
ncbi:hypothetical protein X801_04068, partial [Opisthorchis viverrini]